MRHKKFLKNKKICKRGTASIPAPELEHFIVINNTIYKVSLQGRRTTSVTRTLQNSNLGVLKVNRTTCGGVTAEIGFPHVRVLDL